MKNKVLVTRPKHDITTCYLFAWAEKIIKLAEKKGIQVLDLKKNRANKKEFTSMIKKMKPLLVFCNGHGNKDLITGDNNAILVKAGLNEELFDSKIIYALSCRSAKKLGPACIKSGTLAYIGYEDDFIFFHEEKSSRFTNDKTAAIFLNPSNQIMISLMKGNEVKEAHARSQEYFQRNIQKLVITAYIEAVRKEGMENKIKGCHLPKGIALHFNMDFYFQEKDPSIFLANFT